MLRDTQLKRSLIIIDLSIYRESEALIMVSMLQKQYCSDMVYLGSVDTEMSMNLLENVSVTLQTKKALSSNLQAFSNKYYLDAEAKKVIYKNRVIQITNKERDLLALLILHQGKAVSYSEIIEYIWKYDDVTKNNIRNLVYRLRDKFDHDIIKSLPHTGYTV